METEVIIIGAGASGLMAARELGKAGKKVIILEARNRVGGRIWPLDEKEFGYPAQGGAEFVHGPAPVTKALLKEAGLTYVSMPKDGEMWTVQNGELIRSSNDPLENKEFVDHRKELQHKLRNLTDDIPISVFLNQNFSDKKYTGLRSWIMSMVQGFDAADPNQISTFSLRDEWLGQEEWKQGRVEEGYGKVLEFLEDECNKYGVDIIFNQKVRLIERKKSGVIVSTFDGENYDATKVIVTVALPIISEIEYKPALPEKIKAASKIGFGQVIKLLLRFNHKFWPDKMVFLLSGELAGIWWTQYPKPYFVLTGWVAGPRALELKDKSDADILDLALTSLSNIFKIDRLILSENIIASKVINWSADRLAKGA